MTAETGSAYGGGTHELTDRYVAGFLWLSKLGDAALGGISVLNRQRLYGGTYSLLDQNLYPLPVSLNNVCGVIIKYVVDFIDIQKMH